jgi:NADH-quinone oxidoreductase subunit K
MIVTALFFYLFAGVCIAAAVMVIASRNPVHSVLFLILTFFNAAGLFLLMGAEFLAMILVVVYVGAVAVLFLFVVMMLDVDFAELRQGFLRDLSCRAASGCRRLDDRAVDLAIDRGANPADCERAQHRGDRSGPLYPIHLLLPGSRAGAPGRHDRRDRAHLAAPREGQASGHRQAGGAHQGDRDRGRQGSLGAGAVMTITLGHYLTVAAILFTLGIFGIFLNRKNVIVILMSIELILLAVNINLVAFSTFLGDLIGQIFALMVLTVAAAEAAIGLAILVVYFRNRKSIAVEDVNLMKG